LVKKSLLTPTVILDPCERYGLFQAMPNPKLPRVKGLDNKPLVHHYSWVRDKLAMLKKVTTWGHHLDKDDWKDLVEKEFSGPFSGKDFFSDYQYQIVEPFIDFRPGEPAHRTTSQELFRKSLISEFEISPQR
ncbi:MAG TPA: hypothetical protein VLG44_05595, partial [Chlamydiales bacterium]|nr:hypothetical protein [Chlamydiales bacterium]